MSPQTARQTERELLAGLAAKTLTRIPALNGRVEKACKLVLGGDVALHQDGTALVNSLTDPTRTYQVTGTPGQCQCQDYDRAPEHLCCHRLAVGLTRKVQALLPQSTGVETGAASQPLPEAPVSITLKAMLHGHEVLVTLRGHDFASVQAQVEQASQWLQRQTPPPSTLPQAPQCPTHGAMKPSRKGKGWYCPHKDSQGQWCPSKGK